LLAKTYYEIKEYSKALELIEKILLANDKYIQAYILKAKIKFELNEFDEAKENINCALKLDINTPEAHFINGRIHFEKGEYESALNLFKTAVSISPQNKLYYEFTGKAYYKLENYIDAYAYFKEAAEIDISNPEYRYYMAMCSVNSNDVENAISNFSVLKRLAPASVIYAKEYAEFLNSNGNKKMAISILKSTEKLLVAKEEKEKIKKLIETLKK